MKNILTVIPAHNEEETIREVVMRSLAYSDVSVTDDGSTDQTPSILKEMALDKNLQNIHLLHIIRHEKATHIPKGIQDGIKYGVDRNYDFIITMDAGLSHDPDALQEFIDFDPSIDVVIGMRKDMENVPIYRRVISKLAAFVVNYALTDSYFNVMGPGLRDCTSGFRRYSKEAAKLIAKSDLKSKAFDFHMEVLALCVRNGLTAAELPIRYVFSNSSFNGKVLKQAMKFGMHLIITKGKTS